MSTATETKSTKPAAPLGSFLTKLAPKPAEKPVEKPAEKSAEVNKETADGLASKHTDAERVKDSGSVGTTAEGETSKAALSAETVQDPKPKEDVNEKRLKDTQKWGNEEHKARLAAEQRALDLEAKLTRIEQKLDGTYEEPTTPSAEQVKADADIKGRIRASHHAAVRQYGEEFVMSTVWAAGSPYQELQAKSPRLRARVMEAEDPVLEAIAVVKEHQDGEKYGRTPEEIRKKMEAELAPKLKQDILDGLKTKPGPATNTLGNVRGDTERVAQKSEAADRLDFRKVFPWGAARI